MADIRDYSTTASSNTDIAPENMAPSAVNDAIRTVQAELAQDNKDEGGTLTLGGTGTAYTLTLNTSPAALSDGLDFSVTANTAATGGATTLVVTPNGGSAFASKKIKTYARGSEEDLWANAMVAGGHYEFEYDSAADSGTGAYILQNPSLAAGADAATQAQMEAGSSNTVYATPGRQKHHPAHPKAWGFVNGGTTPTIGGSSGVTSISRSSTGIVSVTLSPAMSSTNYAVVTGMANPGVTVAIQNKTVNGFDTVTRNISNAAFDGDFSFVVLGDQ